MKRTILFSVCMVLVLVALPLVSACKAAETPAMTLRYTTNITTAQAPGAASKYWGDLITERTDGRIKFEYLWGGSLTKAGEELEAIQRGVADAGFYCVGFYPSKMILNGVSYVVPFDTTDAQTMLKMYDKLSEEVPELAAETEQYNQKVMWYTTFASYELQSVEPIKTLADLKGAKVAAIGATFPRWFKAIGAIPVSMTAPDRYTGLQTGLLDASCLTYKSHDSFKMAEVAKNCTLIHIGAVILGPVVMNMDTWNKISPKDQEIIMQASKEAAQWMANRAMEEEAEIKARWVDLGVKTYEFSEADLAAWAEAVKYLPYDWAAEWDAKGLTATKTMDAYLKAAEELGHKYPIKWAKR